MHSPQIPDIQTGAELLSQLDVKTEWTVPFLAVKGGSAWQSPQQGTPICFRAIERALKDIAMAYRIWKRAQRIRERTAQ